jgi:hypothetical protein
LFGVCLYCCCRINEACTLSVNDAYDRVGRARAELIIPKGNIKGKLATRAIPELLYWIDKTEAMPVQEVIKLVRSNGMFQSLHTSSLFFALDKLGKISFNE